MARQRRSNSRRLGAITPPIASFAASDDLFRALQGLRPRPLATPLTAATFEALEPDYGASLSEIEDNRYWQPQSAPLDYPPARSLSTLPALLRVGPPPRPRARRVARSNQFLPYSVAFRTPSAVTLCVRRARRRQVLHALGRTHFNPRARRNRYSTISCRR